MPIWNLSKYVRTYLPTNRIIFLIEILFFCMIVVLELVRYRNCRSLVPKYGTVQYNNYTNFISYGYATCWSFERKSRSNGIFWSYFCSVMMLIFTLQEYRTDFYKIQILKKHASIHISHRASIEHIILFRIYLNELPTYVRTV